MSDLENNTVSLRDYLDARFDAIDARFDAVDSRFDGVNARFDGAYSVFEPAVWIIAGSLIAVILEKRFRWFSKAWHWICGTSQ